MRWDHNRRIVPLVGMVAAAALLVAAFIQGLLSFGQVRGVVAEEFNAQQLVLARNLSMLIRQDLSFLERELLVLSQLPCTGNAAPAWASRMRNAMTSIGDGKVIDVRCIDASGTTARIVAASGEERIEQSDFVSAAPFEWAMHPGRRGEVLVVPSRQPVGLAQHELTLIMATGQYSPPVGPEGPKPPAPAGVIMFAVDAPALARRFTAEARSGTTGYAWVIDDEGIFLAHPMADFIGKNAFTARHERDPHLGFEGINVIMRDHMLRGEEGVGEYESGWHRQEVGPVQKLIGYSPIRLGPTRSALRWSVAVVAPTSEVQGMVRALFLRQLFVQSAIALAILAGSVSLLRRERYWSQLQKQKERQINLNSRLAALGTLAAGVAHEVNNPIAIILGFTDLLREQTPKDSPSSEPLEIIERQATACKRIVENLGRFARGPAGGGETTDLNVELQRVLAIVGNTLLTEKIQCALDLEESVPLVRGDPQGIQQVLLNLITNARAAMKSGGTLTLRTRREGGSVRMEISDTGHGIPSPVLERIFDPFFTTKAAGEGTGLGLFISHGIIQEAGGTMAVESRAETDVGRAESGTTVRVSLPVAPSSEGADSGQAGPAGK
ncbi:MAG: ATP-binding protein [Acidobacteriota bacterium]